MLKEMAKMTIMNNKLKYNRDSRLKESLFADILCIKYYMYSSFAMSFKTTSSIIIITNDKDLINILHQSILLMCVPLILVALKYILTCDNGMNNKISL